MPSFVLGDEVYGSDYKFRRFLEERARPYVVAVTSRQRLWIGFEQYRVNAIAATLTDQAWRGSKRCMPRGIVPLLPRRDRHGPYDLGKMRWVLERRLAWVKQLRRLRTRYEQRGDLHAAFLELGCCAI